MSDLIDETDTKILQILRTDGRASNVEIARSLEVTETTVRKRIASMLNGGLIEIVAVPTPLLAGYNASAIIGISVRLDSIRKVSDQLMAFPEVRYCGLATGRYDIMVEAFFSDNDHLLHFTVDVLGSIAEITDVETSLILKIQKFSYEWQSF